MIESSIPKLYKLLQSRVFTIVLPPTVGLSTFIGFVEYILQQTPSSHITGGQLTLALIVVGVATIITGILGQVVRLKLGLATTKLEEKKVDLTGTQSSDSTSITIVKLIQEEVNRTEEISRKFWSSRIDEVRNQAMEQFIKQVSELESAHEDKIKFWVDREEKLRNEKHDIANNCQTMTLQISLLRLKLKDLGFYAIVESETVDILPMEKR